MRSEQIMCRPSFVALATAMALTTSVAATEHITDADDQATMGGATVEPPVPPGEGGPALATPEGAPEVSTEPAHEDGASSDVAEVEPGGTAFGVVVITLSRGSGVPEESRRALETFRTFLGTDDAGVSGIEEAVIGLEGERRLCATFENRAAAELALAEAQRLAEGVDLINVDGQSCHER